MQIFKLYSIYDEKAKAFAPPYAMFHDGEALRAFGDLVQDPQSKINKHPSDYKLFRVGEFNNANGAIAPEPEEMPHLLGAAMDFVKQSK